MTPLLNAARLFVQIAPVLLGLGLAGAVGRVLQVGRLRRASGPLRAALEIAVEGSRVVMVLAIVGAGDPIAGARALGALLQPGATSAALARLQAGWAARWQELLTAFALFALVAVGANLAIFALARAAPLRVAFVRLGGLDPDDGGLPLAIVLFVKNLTIIPFTMVWLWTWLVRLHG